METEKIKTLDDIKEMVAKEMNYRDWDECINDQPNWMVEEVMDKVAEEYASQLKQPPVSVMPSDEEIAKHWKRRNCFGQYAEGLNDGAIWMRDNYLSLSKEAPKEQESGNYFCAQWSDVGFVCEEQCDRCKKAENMPAEPPSKERETAIEFANWIEKSSGYYPIYTPGTKFNGSWDAKDGTESDGKIITTDQLFDLFKQRNK